MLRPYYDAEPRDDEEFAPSFPAPSRPPVALDEPPTDDAPEAPQPQSEVRRLADEVQSLRVDPSLLERALDADKRETGMGRASDALYSAFSQRPLQQRGETNRHVGALQREEVRVARGAQQQKTAAVNARKAAMEDPSSGESETARAMFLATPAGREFAAEMGDYFKRLPASQIPGADDLLRLAEIRRARDAAAKIEAEEAAKRQRDELDKRGFTAGENEKDRASRERAAELEAGGRREKEAREATAALRREFASLPEVKNYKEVDASYRSLQETAKDTSGPGGIATIFNVMKILDPGVAVMSGDVELIRASGGPAARYANLYEQVLSGNPLPPAVRENLLKVADSVYRSKRAARDEAGKQYTQMARELGYDPRHVVIGDEAPQSAGASVKMRNARTGEVGMVDAAEAEEAEANGWERVP